MGKSANHFSLAIHAYHSFHCQAPTEPKPSTARKGAKATGWRMPAGVSVCVCVCVFDWFQFETTEVISESYLEYICIYNLTKYIYFCSIQRIYIFVYTHIHTYVYNIIYM